MIRQGGWYWYLSGEETKLEKHKCGKWMYFCYECKCTDMEVQLAPTGVICFYLNGDDIENHKRVIQFMMDNDLIRKTKTGRYYNNSFKFDDQTRAGEYGADFEGKIKLDQFIDLKTGKWIRGEVETDGK